MHTCYNRNGSASELAGADQRVTQQVGRTGELCVLFPLLPVAKKCRLHSLPAHGRSTSAPVYIILISHAHAMLVFLLEGGGFFMHLMI